MVMLNDLDRFHLVMDVIDRVPGLGERAAHLRQEMVDERLRHRAYTREHGDDPPEVRDWTWPGERARRRLGAQPVRVLVVNAGSSSLKLRVLGGDDATLAARELAGSARRRSTRASCARRSRTALGAADAVGHRIVHGGERFREPVVIDGEVESRPARAGRAGAAAPAQVARRARRGRARRCPACRPSPASTPPSTPRCRAAAATYALPARWRERWGLRRYGFHGLSHAWVARRAPRAARRARRRPADRQLPPGRRCFAVRDRRRTLASTRRWASRRSRAW